MTKLPIRTATITLQKMIRNVPVNYKVSGIVVKGDKKYVMNDTYNRNSAVKRFLGKQAYSENKAQEYRIVDVVFDKKVFGYGINE